MPLLVPNLDDRRWADLVEEARLLIPRLSPRWTDHNFHDPGITFVELFAWLAEMQIYQLNRVGARQREAFARLAGIQRRARRPARVEIEVQGDLLNGVFLPAGTKLSPLEVDDVVFETPSDLWLTQSRLAEVIVNDGSADVDQTQANAEPGVTFLAFGERAEEGAQLRLGFDAFYPGNEPEIQLSVDLVTDDLDTLCTPADPFAQTGNEEQGVGARPVELVWEYQKAGGRWERLEVLNDETAGLSRSGGVTLATPGQPPSGVNRVWIRCRIARGSYDIEPRLQRISLNMLPCVQRETVRDEVLGLGNERPDQSFVLAKNPVLTPSPSAKPTSAEVADWDRLAQVFQDTKPLLSQSLLSQSLRAKGMDSRAASRARYERIYDLNRELATSDEAGTGEPPPKETLDVLLGRTPVVVQVGDELWHSVISLEDAKPEDRQFVFDADAGRVEFGNGLNGRVPRPGERIVAVWYQTSAGRSGNVAKDLRWRFLDAVAAGATLTNPAPAIGGADPESLDELELRAQARVIETQRAVTLPDFETLALQTPGVYVARAKALANCPTPDSITVVAVPKVRPGRSGPPKAPSDAFLGSVRRQLQRRRLLGDDLRVVAPVYVEVRVSARLRLIKGAGPAAVVERARTALNGFLLGKLDPIDQSAKSDEATTQGMAPPTPCPTQWPFGRPVFPSEVYAILDGVAGVDSASGVALTASTKTGPVAPNTTGAIAIPRLGLVFPGEHTLIVDSDARVNP